MFYVQLMLTDKCNQNCYYCDINDKNVTKTQEVNLDYIKWIIEKLNEPDLFIELTGGEIGLCTNLPEVIDFCKQVPTIKKIQGMSNGLVRSLFPNTVQQFDVYYEHLVKDIHGRNIIKFHDIPFLKESNAKTVIVSSPETVHSLLENFEYYDDMGLFSKYFWHKLFVDRTLQLTHKEDLIELYTKMGSSKSKYYADKLESPIDKGKRNVCSKYPWQPVIDVERGKIIHCAYHQYNNQIEVDATAQNLNLLTSNKLFLNSSIDYCNSCYLYNDDYRRIFRGNI